MRNLLRILPVLLLAPWLASCASAQAKDKPDETPAMNVPPAPPRVIEIAPEPLPEPVPDLPPSTTPARPPRRETPKTGASAAEAKPESKPTDVKPPDQPAEQPAPAVGPPGPVAPAPQLRTPQTADTSNAAKAVRATIDRAFAALGTVNYGTLSNERKKAYNDAKSFLQQADDALGRSDINLAQGLAEKAERLAKELAGK
jgi:outer membrane biosynthesis protein TonB